MGGRKRKFFGCSVNHIYQNTANGVNIFYSLEDYLVYFTIFSNTMSKYGVTVLGLCLMYDHIHALLSAPEQETLSQSVSETTSRFVREYNAEYSRKGNLFNSPFGSAVKIGDKKVRTAIAYLYNNPVEKRLCNAAEQYRWNFLAYVSSRCPFSEKHRCSDLSAAMLRARREVKNIFSSGLHTNYVLLKRLMATLNMEEKDMLADYIVSLYSRLDVKALTGYYGSYRQMLIAINSNTGSEYDIQEQFYKAPDTVYGDMIRCTEDVCGIRPAGKVISLPACVKQKLYLIIRNTTGAQDCQIKKFLHIEILRATSNKIS